MRNKTGVLCMFLGAALMIGALSLFIHNQSEANSAMEASAELMPQLVEAIEIKQEEASQSTEATLPQFMEIPSGQLDPEAYEMTEVEIDGYGYIGYISMPSLELDLPVMGDWDYKRLKIAPCRYAGTVLGEDLVIMAHNYTRHFGKLKRLSEGDTVTFTDMEGDVTVYEVLGLEILAPASVDEVKSGSFDLTLFTCTYGGKSRVTVYCDMVKE